MLCCAPAARSLLGDTGGAVGWLAHAATARARPTPAATLRVVLIVLLPSWAWCQAATARRFCTLRAKCESTFRTFDMILPSPVGEIAVLQRPHEVTRHHPSGTAIRGLTLVQAPSREEGVPGLPGQARRMAGGA